MSFYDNELRQLQQQVRRRAYLENRLSALRAQNAQLNSKTAQLLAVKVNEQSDVDRLEGRSLAAFFYKVVGKKDEKLDKEREEAYAAAVKYDIAVREHEAVKSDIEFCLKELKELTGCEEKYRQLLEQKKASVKNSSSEQAERIVPLEESLAALENREREIREAVEAGREAEKLVRQVKSSIVEARNYGNWDILGGGVLSDIAKHGALDEAQGLIEKLQVRLRRFNTELADIDVNTDIQVNIDGFLRFADFFFDGVFADMSVQNRIKEAQVKITDTEKQIYDKLVMLSEMLNGVRAEKEKLNDEIDECVINS